MRYQSCGWLAAWAVLLLVVTACQDTNEMTLRSSTEPSSNQDVVPLCLPGCTETDPFPDSAGVFLSSAVTDITCLESVVGTDTDQDNISNRCENDLASAFAPMLRYNNADDVGHESRWAVRRNGDYARIIYLLAYYKDLGVQGSNNYTACKLSSIGEILSECDGHSGDSEHLVLDVYYNERTKHWLLYSAKLSHHGGYIWVVASSKGYPVGLKYSRRNGADPLIWVATGKHANYPSQRSCDEGTGGGYFVDILFSFDTCQGNDSFFRIPTGGPRNIGSSTVRQVNCVNSENPIYQSPPRQECFWTAQASGDRFWGWQLDHTTSSEGYPAILNRNGFGVASNP